MASSHGLVVKAEDLWPRGTGLKSPLWRPFFRHHSFGSKLGTKNSNPHCCMCCNPANGRVDFEEWLAYKFQLHGIEWIVSLSADWDQSPTKKKKKKAASALITFPTPPTRKARGGLTVKAPLILAFKLLSNFLFHQSQFPVNRRTTGVRTKN